MLLIDAMPDYKNISKWYYYLGMIYEEFISKIDDEMNKLYWKIDKFSNKQFYNKYKVRKIDRSNIIGGSMLHEVAYSETIEKYSKHKKYIKKIPFTFNIEYTNEHYKKVLESRVPHEVDHRIFIFYI